MFDRFRIKAALRAQVIGLRREGTDVDALAQAELIFFEPAFVIAPMMKQRHWTAEQAMVFMVTDVVLEAQQQGNVVALAREDPATHDALRLIYRHVVAYAEGNPDLASCVSRPHADQSVPFSETDGASESP